MTPDRLVSPNDEQVFLKKKIEVRDANGNGTWVEWGCSVGLLDAVGNLSNSLIALGDEGKKVFRGRGLRGSPSLLNVWFYDHRAKPDPQPFNFNNSLPIDLNIIRIPNQKWRPINVEVDSSLIFVRFHLQKNKDLLTQSNQPIDWSMAVVTGIDTLTRYNMSTPISNLIKSTIPGSPNQEITENYLHKILSIYP